MSCSGVSFGAQPFLAVMLRQLFPKRPIVVVAEGLKTQESLQQDIETWFRFLVPRPGSSVARQPEAAAASHTSAPPLAAPDSRPFFYPGWEALPHEAKLPHPDVISERLETLVALLSATGPEAGEQGPNQRFYKGLIQLAGAFVHLQKHRLRPAAALFRLARANLQPYPRVHERLDTGQIVASVDVWLSTLEESGFTANPLETDQAPKLALIETS